MSIWNQLKVNSQKPTIVLINNGLGVAALNQYNALKFAENYKRLCNDYPGILLSAENKSVDDGFKKIFFSQNKQISYKLSEDKNIAESLKKIKKNKNSVQVIYYNNNIKQDSELLKEFTDICLRKKINIFLHKVDEINFEWWANVEYDWNKTKQAYDKLTKNSTNKDDLFVFISSKAMQTWQLAQVLKNLYNPEIIHSYDWQVENTKSLLEVAETNNLNPTLIIEPEFINLAAINWLNKINNPKRLIITDKQDPKDLIDNINLAKNLNSQLITVNLNDLQRACFASELEIEEKIIIWDKKIKEISDYCINNDWRLLITSSYAWAEDYFNPAMDLFRSEPSNNPIPLIVVEKDLSGLRFDTELSSEDLSLMPTIGQQSDIAPTILDLLNIEPPTQWQGGSLITND